MFPSECLVQLLRCACLQTCECVCMYGGCACEPQLEKEKPKPNLVMYIYKETVVLCWKTNPRQRSAYFSAIHTKSAQAGFPDMFCCVGSSEALKHYVNVCFSSSTSIKLLGKLLFFFFFNQAVSFCLGLICLKYYLPLTLFSF